MFGEQPPQDLFVIDQARLAAKKQAANAARSAPTSPVSRNEKLRRKQSKHSRPSTAESAKRLLGSSADTIEVGDFNVGSDTTSEAYFHYRSSLISLSNIVDNVSSQGCPLPGLTSLIALL